ncbi:MAG: 50S ribosomal protein L32 [Oligoflexia bacterium]|nr:50S ribosomal protein L32 [Oligoflexia bacterium]
MPVPKKKTSKSRRDTRRAHHALEKTGTIICSKCGERKILHRVCSSCGTYRGREVINRDEE